MCFGKLFSVVSLVAACFAMVGIASADSMGVAVGSSTLIGTLDYSDTFTTSANGGNSARVDSQWPLADVAAAAAVENNYGNTARSWSYVYSESPAGYTQFGSINTDSTASGGTLGYPTGGSGAGSATGMTQFGFDPEVGGPLDFGIAYGLRTKFVVQFDGVVNNDRLDISIGSTNDTIFSAHGLSVFFRAPGEDRSDLIGLYNVGVGETLTAFTSGFSGTREWTNIAVAFDLNEGLLDVYTNEVHRGQINLKTFKGGAYWDEVDASTNDYVIIGGNVLPGDDRLWTDNFQVGAVPEPSTVALLAAGLLSLLAYAWRKRK